MRAVWLREFGPPSCADARRGARARSRDVRLDLIDVEYANITFVETQVRAGRGPFPVQLPMIPGNGVGGTLDGRRVVASLNGSGGYAERAVPGELFDVPDDLPLDHAVALLADGRTATLLTDAAALQPGERVLGSGRGGRRRHAARPARPPRRRDRDRRGEHRGQAPTRGLAGRRRDDRLRRT